MKLLGYREICIILMLGYKFKNVSLPRENIWVEHIIKCTSSKNGQVDIRMIV